MTTATVRTARAGSFPVRFRDYRCPKCDTLLTPGTTAFRSGGQVYCLDCHPEGPAPDKPAPKVKPTKPTRNTPRPARRREKATLARLEAFGTGPLTARYRPRRLAAIFGQDAPVAWLTSFAAEPYPAAFILEGETGTGKTTAALALAAELGCGSDEFGGLWQIASGEQSAEAVREMARRMWVKPMLGSGWKVLVVNEVDRMHPQAEAVWLDVLEHIPPRTVVVFTTNFTGKLSPRFRDRCTRLAFESDAATLRKTAEELVRVIWRRETGTNSLRAAAVERIVEGAVEEGKLSMRRVVQGIAPALLNEPRAR